MAKGEGERGRKVSFEIEEERRRCELKKVKSFCFAVMELPLEKKAEGE